MDGTADIIKRLSTFWFKNPPKQTKIPFDSSQISYWYTKIFKK